MEKIFVLGVGCQKGGTTWLYKQLIKSEAVNFGYTKEYHVLDTIYTPYLFNNKPTLLEILRHHLNKNKRAPANLLRQLLFLEDESTYYHYFNELWAKNKNTKIVGDITPSYCGLKKVHLSTAKRRLEHLGFIVKIIFIMRDPVQRTWSACRHEKRFNPAMTHYSENDLVLHLYKSPGFEARSRYDSTIKNIESIFDQENIFYCLYENLFNKRSIDKLSNFLGVNADIFDAKDHVNTSFTHEELSEATVREVAMHYSSVYELVGSRFAIKNFWDSSLKIIDQ